MENNENMSTTDEAHIASMLKAAGQREAVPEHLKQNWSNHFRQQLDHAVRRRRQRKLRWLAACASIMAITVISLLVFRQPVAVDVIEVVRLTGNSVLISNTGNTESVTGQVTEQITEQIKERQALVPGSVLQTGEMSALSINYRHFDLRMNANTRLQIDRDRLTLLAGEVYVRSTSYSAPNGIIVATPFATIRDIGTQFIVSLTNDAVISTVREGSILVQTADNHTTATVSNNEAQQVSVNQQRQIEVTATDSSGEQWQWIYAVTPPYQLDGKSVYEFLRWSVRESGLTLSFTDGRAEIYARTTLLHGDLPELSPQAAVTPVLATTHLTATTDNRGTLLIQLDEQY